MVEALTSPAWGSADVAIKVAMFTMILPNVAKKMRRLIATDTMSALAYHVELGPAHAF